MGDVHAGIVGIQLVPFFLDGFEDFKIVPVHVGKMGELVVGHAVEGEGIELCSRQSAFAVHAAEVRTVLAPYGGLEMESREACLDGFLSEPVERLAALFHATEAIDEVLKFVNHEDGVAVDGVVIGLREISIDDSMDDNFEFMSVDIASPNDGRTVVVGLFDVPKVIGIVICPHEIEFHFVSVGCFQKAVVEALFEERSSVVPVPVIDKDIDAMVNGSIDFHGHDVWVCFVDISPEWFSWPIVFWCLFDGVFDGLPFAHAFFPEHSGSRFVSCVRWPDKSRHISFGCVSHVIWTPVLRFRTDVLQRKKAPFR